MTTRSTARAGIRLAAALGACAALRAGTLPVGPDQVKPKSSAAATFEAGVVRLRFDDPRGDSGVRLLPPPERGAWDFSQAKVLAADLTNLSRTRQVRLNLLIRTPGDAAGRQREASAGIALNPGETRTIRLVIPHRWADATPEGAPGPRTLDSARIASIDFAMQWPFEAPAGGLVDCAIASLRTEGRPSGKPALPAQGYFPFVDRFGQYAHADWPQKIRAAADLVANREREREELDAARAPDAWNRFGGWEHGPRLKATGSFRTEKHDGKWYLVDPDGRLFFSHGLDVLYAHTDATRTQGRENWFEPPVPDSGTLAFTDTNLKLKYGKADYAPEFYDDLARRLGAWGFNTIGNWGNSNLIARQRLPYTLQLMDFDRKLPRIGGNTLKFYDVFDAAYVEAMASLIPRMAAAQPVVERSLTDPLCIGYFIDNELNFGNRAPFELAKAILRSPPAQAMKQEFARDLRAKYVEIDRLNTAWGRGYRDWDDFAASTSVPGNGAAFAADADAFTRKSIERYFRLCRDAVKSVAPHRLYLGCRFISTDAVRPVLHEASRKYCDVLSVNVYAHSTANLWTESFPDMPVLIGEFHFGVLDRGMFSPGLCPAGVTQQERALAYTRFLQGALAHPLIVGAHWFQFRDQPLTGRWDGEGYAIGFVDVADTPYAEMTRASRGVGESMYHYRQAGELVNSMEP